MLLYSAAHTQLVPKTSEFRYVPFDSFNADKERSEGYLQNRGGALQPRNSVRDV
jgi:hypothetical protein